MTLFPRRPKADLNQLPHLLISVYLGSPIWRTRALFHYEVAKGAPKLTYAAVAERRCKKREGQVLFDLFRRSRAVECRVQGLRSRGSGPWSRILGPGC